MLRKLAIAIAASGAMMSATYVHALGMGDIELESALNQPLEAHIKLIKAGELENWEIKPDLASSGEFQKSGIEHVFFLNNLKFEVERSGDDVFIKLSTNQPVVEPFLNFLVQVDWPNGRLLREYTLLLDPPVFTQDPADVVTAPEVEESFDTGAENVSLPGTGAADIDDLADIPDVMDDESELMPQPEGSAFNEEETLQEDDVSGLPDVEEEILSDTQSSDASEIEEIAPAMTLEVEEPEQPRTYTVKNDDTLWEVALRTRPNRSVSPQQAMLALQDLNPDAFIGGNINRLKKNQVLRVPSEDQIRSRNFKESVSEVAFQNQFLNQRKAQLDATSKSQVIERNDELAGAELKLLAGGAATATTERGAGGEVVAQAAGDQSKLDNDLSLALEDLDKSKRNNLELSARLDLLEEQIKTLQRIISLKDEQMVALQAGFAKSGDANKVDPRQAELDKLAAESVAVEKSKTDLNFSEPENPSATEELSATQKAVAIDEKAALEKAKAASNPKPKAKFTPLPEVIEDEPFDVVDFAMENPPVLGGVLGALLLSLLGVNYARKRKEKLAQESEVSDMTGFDGMDPLDQLDNQLEGDFDDEFSDLEISGGDDLADDELVTRVDEFGESDTGIEQDLAESDGEATDVLGEAEIYIAYDRMDQARTLLEKTLDSQPGRMDVRLKLMEVLSSVGDQAAIAQHYDYVVAQGSDDDQQKAGQFRNAIESQVNDELNLDSPLDLEISSDPGQLDDLDFGSADAGDGDLNFDLDGLGLDDEPSQDIETLDLDSDDGNSLDFDINLDEGGALELNTEVGEQSTVDNLGLDVASLDLAPETESTDLDFSLDLDEPDTGSSDIEFDLNTDASTGSELDFDIPELNDELSDDLVSESDGLSIDESIDDMALDLDFADDISLDTPDQGSDLDLNLDEGDELSFDMQAEELPVLEDLDELNLGGSLDEDLDTSADLSFDLEEDSLPVLSDDAELSLDTASLDEVSLDDVSLDLDLDLGTDLEVDLAVDSADEGLDTLSVEHDPLEELDQLSAELDAELLDFDSSVSEEPIEATQSDASLDISDLDADLDFLSGTDESETKLDLARAYIDMDDKDGAKEILQEVLEEGTDQQKQDAGSLMDSLA